MSIARDAEVKERLGGRNVAGGRGCVPVHDQLPGDIANAKKQMIDMSR
jgi:hypothetical protein